MFDLPPQPPALTDEELTAFLTQAMRDSTGHHFADGFLASIAPECLVIGCAWPGCWWCGSLT